MKYVVMRVKGNDSRLISQHDTLEEGMKAGEKAWEDGPKEGLVECSYAELDGSGKIVGKHWLYKAWY